MTERTFFSGRRECDGYRLAVLVAALFLTQATVFAQDAPQPVAAEVPPRNYWIEPRVAVGLTLASTGGGATGEDAEQTLEFSPGLRWVANTSRLRGSLDYTLRTLLFAGDGTNDNVRHQLRGNATFNAWDNRAFIDLASVVEGRSISALGAPPAGSLTNTNEAETATFEFSPYLRGPLNTSVDYEVRYRAQILRTAADNRSDINVGSSTARFASSQTSRLLGWSVDFSSVNVDYSLDRSSRRDSVGGQLSYAVLPELRLFVLGGVESENIAQQARERTTNSGVGVDWRPSLRTRGSAQFEKRYFGNSHNLLLERRTGRTTWRYTDTKSVADSLINTASGFQSTVGEVIDELLALEGLDPTGRGRVLEELRRRQGRPDLSENDPVFTNLLTSATTVFRTQELSVILEGRRSLVSLAMTQTKSSRLGALITLGDDFDNGATIHTKGWSLTSSYRFTPLTAGTLVLNRVSNTSSVAGAANTVNGLTVGLTTRLGPRTSAEIRLRHTKSDLRSNENVFSSILTHRF